ncbi:hypothetical protein F4861DRAFT_500012 [Xylaria intraflava]|nr:hypothetical protein F4861DRAFT_500012 [Xylaria intraflava]
MVSTTFLLSLLAGTAVAFPPRLPKGPKGPHGPGSTASSVPACGATIESCECPSGTFFQESTSYAMIYADTGDLTELISNFTNTAWFGTTPSNVTGTAENPIRLLVGVVDGTPVPTNEQLISFTDYSGKSDPTKTLRFEDGFLMKFQLVDTPYQYTGDNGAGTIAGTWDTMDVRNVGDSQTMWVWSIYACFSSAFSFQDFHVSAMKNISSTLDSQGKLTKATLGPFSV